MIGRPNIMAKVSRSRASCRTSLVTMAPSRRQKPPSQTGGLLRSSVQSIVAGPSHQMDEDVFQRRLGLLPLDRRIGAIGLDGLEQRRAIGAADMQGRAEGCGGGDS